MAGSNSPNTDQGESSDYPICTPENLEEEPNFDETSPSKTPVTPPEIDDRRAIRRTKTFSNRCLRGLSPSTVPPVGLEGPPLLDDMADETREQASMTQVPLGSLAQVVSSQDRRGPKARDDQEGTEHQPSRLGSEGDEQPAAAQQKKGNEDPPPPNVRFYGRDKRQCKADSEDFVYVVFDRVRYYARERGSGEDQKAEWYFITDLKAFKTAVGSAGRHFGGMVNNGKTKCLIREGTDVNDRNGTAGASTGYDGLELVHPPRGTKREAEGLAPTQALPLKRARIAAGAIRSSQDREAAMLRSTKTTAGDAAVVVGCARALYDVAELLGTGLAEPDEVYTAIRAWADTLRPVGRRMEEAAASQGGPPRRTCLDPASYLEFEPSRTRARVAAEAVRRIGTSQARAGGWQPSGHGHGKAATRADGPPQASTTVGPGRAALSELAVASAGRYLRTCDGGLTSIEASRLKAKKHRLVGFRFNNYAFAGPYAFVGAVRRFIESFFANSPFYQNIELPEVQDLLLKAGMLDAKFPCGRVPEGNSAFQLPFGSTPWVGAIDSKGTCGFWEEKEERDWEVMAGTINTFTDLVNEAGGITFFPQVTREKVDETCRQRAAEQGGEGSTSAVVGPAGAAAPQERPSHRGIAYTDAGEI